MKHTHASLSLAFALVLAGCTGGGGDDDDDDDGFTNTTVAGTATLPAAVTNRCVLIAVDNDNTGQNGAPVTETRAITGSSFTFSYASVASGSYFVWAFVDADGSGSDPATGCNFSDGPDTGDLLGYNGGAAGGPPGAANVTVPHADGESYAIDLAVIP